jgi:glycosyl transferase family 25
MPRVIGITVRRNQQRRDEFEAKHPHLVFEWFDGIDGSSILRDNLIEKGVLASDCTWSDRSIANALGHQALWHEAVATNQSLVVFEDDAIFARDFSQRLDTLFSAVPDDFDLIYLGFNWDRFVFLELFDSSAGIVKLTFSQEKLLTDFDSIQHIFFKPAPFRLRAAWGMCGYVISPAGARKLIEKTLPLNDRMVHPPGVPWRIKAFGMDSLLNEAFHQIESYVSIPPLIYVENNRKTSTIWNVN